MSRRRQSKQLPARIPLQESLILFEKGELPIDETITLTTADDFIKNVFSLPKDNETEITFNQTHLRYCLYKGNYYSNNVRQKKGKITDADIKQDELNHLVGKEFFDEKNLTELISSPVAIIPTKDNDGNYSNRYIIVLNTKHNGSNICLVAEPYGQGTRNGVRFPSMHVASIYAKDSINYRIELEAKREAMAELILDHAKEIGIKIPDELQKMPFYLNKEKHHLLDEYKSSLSILIDKNPTARNVLDEYSKNIVEELKKATKTVNHDVNSSCRTALSSYVDNLLFLTKDVKREKINFDKFDKDLKNNREDLFTHINQRLDNDNTSDEILDRYTLTDYIASKLNVVGIKTYVIDDETIRNYAIIKNNSLNNSDYIPFNTLSQKEFYGFALGNQIYLKEDGIRADVLLHEYAHLFLNVFAKLHADEWKTIKASLKNDPDIIREINGPEYKEKLGSKSEDISLTEYLCDKMAGHGVEALKNANIEDVINMATLSAIDVISPTLLSSERIKNLSTLMMSDLISGQFKKDVLDLNTLNFKERGLFDDMEDDESNNTLQTSSVKEQIATFKKHNFNRTDTFTLTTLNPLLKQVGYTNKEITFDQTHMRYCLYNAYNGSEKEKANHYMGEEFFDKLPELLLSPIAIVPSNTMGVQRQLIILDYKLNDSYVCLSVRADGEGRKNAIRFPSTHVFSICAKEKAEYILNCRINEELEHQKYVNKPCGVYYIDNKKATEMLNSKGFELPRGFNLNGLINNIQGESLIVKQEDTQNHKIGDFEQTKTPILSLTSDEIHALVECITNKSDFVISNPNLNKPVHLVWGSMGDITQTLHGIEGHGLEHFIQRRYESDNKTADELTASILLIADAMKRGQITNHEESDNKKYANLRDLQLVITDVDKDGNKIDRYNFTTCFSNGNVANAIKKEGKDVVQSIINNQIMNNYTPEILLIRNQVVALITSIDRIREEHPIVNDLHEKKSKKIIFLMGDVLNNPQKQLFDKTEQEYKENGVKVINALTIVNNIPGLAEIKKTKTRIGNIIPALRKALKNNDQISEIVFIPHEGEENKIEIDIKEYAAKHGIETTKFEVLENTQETKKEEINNMDEEKEQVVNDLSIRASEAMSIRDKVKEVLRKTDEMMTREDRAILRQYEGVGGLKEEEATVEGALSEFYTPTPIVKKMWELMDAYNPDAYEVLEPTCGRGRFLDGRSDNHFTAYECDDTSARIAKILFPNADIRHDYFQKQFMAPSGRSLRKNLASNFDGVTLPANHPSYKLYDAVIGNPPYGQVNDIFKPFGMYSSPTITHTYPAYFIKEGLAHLKAGGFLAYIVPSTLYDAFIQSVSLHLDEYKYSYMSSILRQANANNELTVAFVNSRLIDAYRLPEGMFPSTRIGTDILVFKKETLKTTEYFSDYDDQKDSEDVLRFVKNIEEASEFFVNHPDHVLGDTKTRLGRYGKEETYIGFKEGETKEDVISKIMPIKELIRPRTREVINGKYEVDKITGEVEKEPEIVKAPKPIAWTKSQTGHVMSEEEFSSKYNINQDLSKEDKEIWKATKYDGSIDTNKLSPSALSHLRNTPSKYIETDKDVYCLKALYTTGNIYTKLDELENKKNAGLIEDKYYTECHKLLKENIPEKIKIEDIHFSPLTVFATEFTVERNIEYAERIAHRTNPYYSSWQRRTINGYASETVYKEVPETVNLKTAFILWALNAKNKYAPYDETTARVKPEDFKTDNNIITWNHVEGYLNGVSIKPNISTWDTDEEKKEKERRAQSLKQDRRNIAEKLFDRFLHEGLTKEEQAALCDKYNKTFNAVVEPDYTKLPLYVSGMHSHKVMGGKDREFTMHPAQLRGVSFLTQKGAGLLAYDVGVGKTTAGIVATVMQLQSGRAKRPLIIVPKSVYNKWWEDIHQHFPDIEVNDLSNLDAEHAAPFLTPDHALNIKEGTISLMTYNGLSDHISFMDESIDENGILSTDLKEILSIKTTGTNREKSLELQKLNSRYGKCIKTKDERYAFFEKTGFDHITVDEAHNFKKLFTMPHADASESIEYKELAQPGEPSTRALKLYCACQLVQANNNDRNVFLLTATPFTNHPFEVFSMLSFMGRKRLRELQVNSIKAFTDKFASTKTDWGVNTSGNVEYITSMKEWRNLKELQGVLHEYFDRVTAEDAGIKRPNKIVVAPILETTPLQKEINLALEKSIINGGNKGEVLTAINNMRKCILSPSLITGSSYKDIDIPHMDEFVESSPKVKLCLDTVIKVYKKYPQGGQVIYCNLTGGNAAMKTYLRKNGIPEKAISIFEGGKRNEERQEKIEKFNNPSNPLKIIIGTSTIKEGVDLNGNSVALWNLTLDWNPSDITQVEGRAWRQGNKQNNVNIIYPLTYNSIDAFMYQKYDEKSSRINELFSYKGNSLSIEDINPMEMKYSLITDPEKRSKLIIDDKKKSIEMTIGGYESEKIKYQKIITKFNREDEMRQKYETETAKYERLKEYNTTEAFVAKNLMNEAKRELDRLQKAKDTLHVYSVEEAQKFIDEIDTRIKAKGEELAEVEKNIPEIIRQVKEEIARTKKPTRTVEEYSEDIADQILASANTNITSLQSESNENTNSQHPVLGNVEEPKIARSKIVKTNTEQKEPHKEEFLTSSEAIKRYGYKFNKKQMLGLKDQLFFAFLIDNKNEHYSGDKNISKALYTRLSRNMANIVLVSAKERLALEKTLARVHGKVDLGNYRIYGWETKDKIFIAEDAISGNALIHEYTHLWSKAVQSSNPLLWEKIKQNVMQTNLFREMYNDERYKDIKHDIDNLCGETLSRLSGADNIARLEERRNSLMVNEYQQSDESTEEALSSLYGWLEEDVFNGYAHTLNLKEITTRILGDALEGKQTEQIQSSYKNQMTYTPNATFNKERALREGYTKLSPILLEQYFSVRSTITPRMKEHYIKHFKSLTKADPQKACEVLQDMVREEALSAHFFNKIRDENYPDKAFRKHFINAYNANAEEKFISLFKNGDSFRVINGVADNDVSSHYTNFKNFVLRDYLKNDNEIAKIVISSFIKSEKGDAVKLLYDACGENMDYRRKIRALLPEIEVENTTHKTRHKVADTFGVINYDTNELLSSAYNTTYIDVNNIRGITSDLTLEERALVLSDDFKRNFGSVHRRDDEEIKALKQSGQYNKEEIKAMEWKEKHYFSDKNEIKSYVIKAIGNGYTLNSLYTNEQVKTAMEKLSAENKETFNKITKEEEVKNAFETTDKMTELKTEQEREQTAEKITAPKPEAQDNRYSIRHASRATVQINPLDKIRSVFNQNGINPPSLLVDGTIHRFDINKKGDKRGWYVLNSDYVNGKSIVYGAGGDWAGDSTVKVVASDGYMSATDNEAFKKRAEEEQRKKEEEREKEKLLARENASRYYSLSKNTSFPDEIPYLTEHGLTIEDALKNGVHYNSYFNAMQVPLYSNTTGELTTLQTISSSRNEESGAYTKMFLKGSDPNVHAIIGVPTSPLVFVCEGWATGVAIQKAVNDRVYAAMCCHNLQNTVEYIRKEHPDKFIVCIADNDSKKETPDIKGKGQIKAEESGADLVITIPNPKEDAADYALKADLRDFIRSSLTHSKEYREFLNNLEEQNEQKLQQKNEVKTMTL